MFDKGIFVMNSLFGRRNFGGVALRDASARRRKHGRVMRESGTYAEKNKNWGDNRHRNYKMDSRQMNIRRNLAAENRSRIEGFAMRSVIEHEISHVLSRC